MTVVMDVAYAALLFCDALAVLATLAGAVLLAGCLANLVTGRRYFEAEAEAQAWCVTNLVLGLTGMAALVLSGQPVSRIGLAFGLTPLQVLALLGTALLMSVCARLAQDAAQAKLGGITWK